MPFFPNHSEVLVSTLNKKEILKRLDLVTQNANFLDYISKHEHLFNGNLEKDGFKICILFLEYSLFPGSAFFLGFWTMLSVILALIFTLLVWKPLLATVTIALGIGNYWFAWSYFKRKIKISQGIFLGLLNN